MKELWLGLTPEEINFEKQVTEDIERIKPVLENDRDWPLVSGQQKSETSEVYRQKRRAVTRLTKKVVKLLYPESKASVKHEGTVEDWIEVNFLDEVDIENYKEITHRTTRVLESLGMYSTYYPDGEGRPIQCLLVTYNGSL